MELAVLIPVAGDESARVVDRDAGEKPVVADVPEADGVVVGGRGEDVRLDVVPGDGVNPIQVLLEGVVAVVAVRDPELDFSVR